MANLMQDFGFSKAQAAGIVGNLAHESAGLVPGIEERGNRIGLGLAQWSNERRVAFEKYLRDTNQSADDLMANYGFLKKELSENFSNVVSALKQTQTAKDAMLVFENLYEKSGSKQYSKRLDAAVAAEASVSVAKEGKKENLVKGTDTAVKNTAKAGLSSAKATKQMSDDLSETIQTANKELAEKQEKIATQTTNVMNNIVHTSSNRTVNSNQDNTFDRMLDGLLTGSVQAV